MKVFIARDFLGHTLSMSKPKWHEKSVAWQSPKSLFPLESDSSAIRFFRKVFPLALKVGECQEVELSVNLKPIGKPIKVK